MQDIPQLLAFFGQTIILRMLFGAIFTLAGMLIGGVRRWQSR